jgi:hypothetical protein
MPVKQVGLLRDFQFAGKVFDLRCAASLRLAGDLSFFKVFDL